MNVQNDKKVVKTKNKESGTIIKLNEAVDEAE